MKNDLQSGLVLVQEFFKYFQWSWNFFIHNTLSSVYTRGYNMVRSKFQSNQAESQIHPWLL